MLQALFLGGNRIGELAEIDRLVPLPTLAELVLANNPCARKPLYRPTALRKLLTLRSLDGREVAPDDRERADLLLSSERVAQPNLHEQRVTGNKVPLKLTSLNFELMAGLPVADSAAMGLQMGSGAPHSAGALGGATSGGVAGAPAWNPMAAGHESYFLPASKVAGANTLPRGHPAERKGSARTQPWRMLDNRPPG